MMSVYGFEGYGKFWALVELLRRDDSYRVNITKKNFFNGIAHYLRSSIEDAKTFLNDCIYEFELFQSDGEYFWSNSLNERMGIMEERSNSKSEAAKIRWEKERKNKQQETTDNDVNLSEPVNDKPKKEKPVRKQNGTIAQCSEEVIQLTAWLIEKIKENNPNAKVNDAEKWQDSIRLLIDTDHYSVDQVKKMIEFSQSDDFWKSNILSAKKLREKAGTLILQMGRVDHGKNRQELQRTLNPYAGLNERMVASCLSNFPRVALCHRLMPG